MSVTAEKEFAAIKAIHDALTPLDGEARERVLNYIGSLLGVVAAPVSPPKTEAKARVNEAAEVAADAIAKVAPKYGTFAELYASANPSSNGEKALVAGYWLQICGEEGTFTAAAANKQLMHLGHKVANITDAIDTMKDVKPQLILQLKKSGTSRQARKLYKLSHEGVTKVESMIGG